MGQDQLRTNEYLEERMYELWEGHFADVPRKNLILVFFGKYSKSQLGSIKWAHPRAKIKLHYKKKEDEHQFQDDKRISLITITKYFQDLHIPEVVVDMTLAHEMVHYSHGFHSPLPKLYNHPHKGNVVNKELVKRGLAASLAESELWLKENWWSYVKMFHVKSSAKFKMFG